MLDTLYLDDYFIGIGDTDALRIRAEDSSVNYGFVFCISTLADKS